MTNRFTPQDTRLPSSTRGVVLPAATWSAIDAASARANVPISTLLRHAFEHSAQTLASMPRLTSEEAALARGAELQARIDEALRAGAFVGRDEATLLVLASVASGLRESLARWTAFREDAERLRATAREAESRERHQEAVEQSEWILSLGRERLTGFLARLAEAVSKSPALRKLLAEQFGLDSRSGRLVGKATPGQMLAVAALRDTALSAANLKDALDITLVWAIDCTTDWLAARDDLERLDSAARAVRDAWAVRHALPFSLDVAILMDSVAPEESSLEEWRRTLRTLATRLVGAAPLRQGERQGPQGGAFKVVLHALRQTPLESATPGGLRGKYQEAQARLAHARRA